MKRLNEEIAHLERTCARLQEAVRAGPSPLGIGYEGFTRLVAHYKDAVDALESMRQRLLEEKHARGAYEGSTSHGETTP